MANILRTVGLALLALAIHAQAAYADGSPVKGSPLQGVEDIDRSGSLINISGFMEPQPAESELQSPEQEAATPRQPQAPEPPSMPGSQFKRKSSYVHGQITVTGLYTDNALKEDDEKKSEYIVIVSPSLWVSAPRLNERLASVKVENVSPGGLRHASAPTVFPQELQLYGFYTAEIWNHSKFSGRNEINHRLSGSVQYNGLGDVSLDLTDTFSRDFDQLGNGPAEELDIFDSNLIKLSATYDPGRRVYGRISASHFQVRYDKERNAFMDRSDLGLEGALYYKFKSKLDVFGGYEVVKINYKERSDGTQSYLFGGAEWQFMDRSKGTLKVGTSLKKSKAPESTRSNSLFYSLQIDHQFDSKKSLTLKGFMGDEESNVAGATYSQSQSLSAIYKQLLFARTTLFLHMLYNNNLYTIPDSADRRDELYSPSVELLYEPFDAVKFSAGYVHIDRHSSQQEKAYRSNMAYITATASF